MMGANAYSHRACVVLGLLIILLAMVSVCIGAAPLSWGEVWQGITGDSPTVAQLIVTEIRLPRTLLAILIGASLGLTGAAMQGWLRNPLADAGLLGTSSCASLGAVLTLYFTLSTAATWVLPASGMVFALGGILIIHALAGKEYSVLTLILAGIALQHLASAGIALALNFAPNPHAALEIAFWLMGSLADRNLHHLYVSAPFIVIGMALLLSTGRALDGLSLGEQTASTLGVDLKRLRAKMVFGASLAVGAGVSVSGSIGFVGLVVPHLLRPIVGHLPSQLLLPSAFAGGALLLAADIMIRMISAGQELKLSIVTGLLGAPFFLYLLLKQSKRMA